MKLTEAMLTGKSRAHLVNLPCPFSVNHFLQADALNAFQGLQQRAKKNGFNLQPASSFRDFRRQQLIWNSKFNGERKVHNDDGEALDLTELSDWQKIQAILRWSALPGASRHHWGTEIDIFDPDLLPIGKSLQLEPWEYEQGGYLFELSQFLLENLSHFDFTLPFMNLPSSKKIGREPWHISHVPTAKKAQHLFSSAIVLNSWQGESIGGKAVLVAYLEEIFARYIL
ncbi:M15 family metallopeptidase [Rodentibacter caecimuris]|uniref:Peptidase M15 n=1 Tax=Rodentibacter caecimuris TaxID=1796644 RepID=A0ABX3L0A2_9PAST|nr:peptidase M15 [Rodentibacter heylii]